MGSLPRIRAPGCTSAAHGYPGRRSRFCTIAPNSVTAAETVLLKCSLDDSAEHYRNLLRCRDVSCGQVDSTGALRPESAKGVFLVRTPDGLTPTLAALLGDPWRPSTESCRSTTQPWLGLRHAKPGQRETNPGGESARARPFPNPHVSRGAPCMNPRREIFPSRTGS